MRKVRQEMGKEGLGGGDDTTSGTDDSEMMDVRIQGQDVPLDDADDESADQREEQLRGPGGDRKNAKKGHKAKKPRK